MLYEVITVPARGQRILLHEVLRARHRSADPFFPTDHAGIPDPGAGAALRGVVLLHVPLLLDALAAGIFGDSYNFV